MKNGNGLKVMRQSQARAAHFNLSKAGKQARRGQVSRFKRLLKNQGLGGGNGAF